MSTIADIKSKLSFNYELLLVLDAARSAALVSFNALSAEERIKDVDSGCGHWNDSIDALHIGNHIRIENEKLRFELHNLECAEAERNGNSPPPAPVARTG
jgi:hypothetical protein